MTTSTENLSELERQEDTRCQKTIEDYPELLGLLWRSLKLDSRGRGGRVITGWGTKTRCGLVRSVQRAILKDEAQREQPPEDQEPKFTRSVLNFIDTLDRANLAEIKEAMKECKDQRLDLAGRISKRVTIADIENLLGAHSRRF